MTFSNIHKQCGYFSNDKTNSSWQLFITRTRELPGDAVMGGESTPQRRKWLVDAGNSSARKVEKPLSKPGVRFCYASYIISCRHTVQYTVVSFSPPVTCICNDRYFLSTAPGRSRSLKRTQYFNATSCNIIIINQISWPNKLVQEMIYDIGDVSFKIEAHVPPKLNHLQFQYSIMSQEKPISSRSCIK